MKTIFITCFALATFILIYAPASEATSEGIHLRVAENSPTKLSLILEGSSISKALIGISATLHLPKGINYQSYTPGQFFEKNNDQVTYLISPKKNDAQTIIIGIASLGKTSRASSGSLVTLHFQKTTATISLQDLKLEKSVASGIENEQRIDFTEIPWSIHYGLTEAGQPLQLALLFTLLTSLIMIALKFRKKLRMTAAKDLSHHVFREKSET